MRRGSRGAGATEVSHDGTGDVPTIVCERVKRAVAARRWHGAVRGAARCARRVARGLVYAAWCARRGARGARGAGGAARAARAARRGRRGRCGRRSVEGAWLNAWRKRLVGAVNERGMARSGFVGCGVRDMCAVGACDVRGFGGGTRSAGDGVARWWGDPRAANRRTPHTPHTPHAAAGAPDTAARCGLVWPRWNPCEAAEAAGDAGEGDGSKEFSEMVFNVSASVC
jgi:hypothetical protein